MEHNIKDIPQGVLTILHGVVKREGGYVNDPDDSGGPAYRRASSFPLCTEDLLWQ